nr:MAG TPA: hypothetical protein [Caudoviricetes sp.]
MYCVNRVLNHIVICVHKTPLVLILSDPALSKPFRNVPDRLDSRPKWYTYRFHLREI